MSPSKRQPSKQKRAAQNRAQRAALEQRREAASAASEAIRSSDSGGSGSSGAGGGGSLLSRLRSGGPGATRAAAGGSAESDASSTPPGRGRPGGLRATAAAGRAAQPVGYRAGLTALLMAVAGLLFCFTFRVPVDADGESYTKESLTADWATTAVRAAADDPGATPAEVVDAIDEWAPGRGTEAIAIALWPFSLALLLPVLAAGIGFRAVSRRRPSKIVSRALFATLFGSLLSQIPIFFLPSVIALGVAVFQIRKYETALAAAALAETDGGGEPPGGIIEADVVDDDEVIEGEIIDGEVIEGDVLDEDRDGR